MKINRLALVNVLPGIGYFQEESVVMPLRDALVKGYRPLQKDWEKLLLTPVWNKRKKDFMMPPRSFSGWRLQNDNEGAVRRNVFFQSHTVLSEALKEEKLVPVCSDGSHLTPRECGLAHTRGITAAHLKSVPLRALGLHQAGSLDTLNQLEIELDRAGNRVGFYRKVGHEIFEGLLLSVIAPCKTRTPAGECVRSAVWVARPSRLGRKGEVIQRYYLVFDGRTLHRYGSLSHAPKPLIEELDAHGGLALVHRDILLAPVSCEAVALARCPDQASQTVAPEPASFDAAALLHTPVFPAFASVRLARRVKTLSLADSEMVRQTFLSYIEPDQKSVAESCDFLVCRRSMPPLGATVQKPIRTMGNP